MSLFCWSRLSLGCIPRLSEAMWKLRIHRVWLSILLANLAMFLFTVQSWSRLTVPPYMADVRDLTERAPLVFRGRVLIVTPVTTNSEPGARVGSIAKIQVDRWYRGNGSTEALLLFAYSGQIFADGHDCIDFRPDTYWVVFAAEKNGQLEMIDDCQGALTISPLLGPDLANADWLAQMEADFIAGLNDNESAARLASIQRLGGLKLPSSRDVLRCVIETGDNAESKWAVYAALRTGDVSVLPRVRQLLAKGDGQLADPRAVPSLAAHLSDPDHYARYDALDGLKNITHEEACRLSGDWKEQDVEPQVSRCKIWWEQVGKFRDWSQNPLFNP